MKYSQQLRLNWNILAALAASLLASAAAAYLLRNEPSHINSTAVLAVDYAAYVGVMGILLYFSIRSRYAGDKTGIWREIAKLITSLGAAEVVYGVSRWLLHYHILEAGYEAHEASIMAQLGSTALFMLAVNLGVRITRLYRNAD